MRWHFAKFIVLQLDHGVGLVGGWRILHVSFLVGDGLEIMGVPIFVDDGSFSFVGVQSFR